MLSRFLLAFALILAMAPAARAQQPPPAPPVVTSQLRQRLRAEILRTARETDARYSNTRLTLAIPLAQLGDWETALRWANTEDERTRPRLAESLWYWRATQLARGGKWNEVAPAAAHLSRPGLRADPLLFAARQMIERGIRLNVASAESRQLEALLNSAAPLLVSGAPDQQAYRAFLYAHGGDVAASRRIFARVLPQAERKDERSRELKKKPRDPAESFMNRDDNVNLVLRWQVASGLLPETLRYAKDNLESANGNSMGWWIKVARTPAELESLTEIVEQLPTINRVSGLFYLSMRNANLSYRERARTQFERANQLAKEAIAAPAEPNVTPLTADEKRKLAVGFRARLIYMALPAALALQDEALIAQTEAELRELAEELPANVNFINLTELPALTPTFELMEPQLISNAPLSLQRLDELFAQLRAAPPSEMQFRALETIATHFYLRKQPDKLLPVAQTMLATARALQKAERVKRAAKKDIIISPYWPQSPRVLTSIFWLQRAGDQTTAAQFARGFAQDVPTRERPYAALALTQLGFFDLADKVFDPAIEIPREQARYREWARECARNNKTPVDWNEFRSWDDFAATQARFRSPEAPFRWIGKIENLDNRAGVLSAWTAAHFPSPPLQAPYVSRTPGGSSSAISGYAGSSLG